MTFDIEDNPELDRSTIYARLTRCGAKLKPYAPLCLESSQSDFAALLGIPVATLQNWEQRRTVPDAVATTLIDLIFDDPKDMRIRMMRRNAA